MNNYLLQLFANINLLSHHKPFLLFQHQIIFIAIQSKFRKGGYEQNEYEQEAQAESERKWNPSSFSPSSRA
jgi:hypothetical protein